MTIYDDLEVVEPSVRVVPGPPAPADAVLEETSVQLRGYILAAQAGDAAAYIGTSGGIYRVAGEDVTLLESHGTGDKSVVAVRSMARWNASVVAATDSGLLVAGDDALTALVAGPELDDIDDIEVTAVATTDAEVWVGSAGALHRLRPDGPRQVWRLDLHPDQGPSGLAAADDAVYVAFEHELYRVDVHAESVVHERVDFGSIAHIVLADGNRLALATAHGLFIREATGDYTHVSLRDSGPATGVDDVAFAAGQGFVAVTRDRVIRFDGDAARDVTTLDPAEAPRAVTVMEGGDIFVGHVESLTRVAAVDPLVFETDIAPLLDEYCMACHAADNDMGVPAIPLTDRESAMQLEDRVLARTTARQMPPPGSPQLSEEQLQALSAWYDQLEDE